MAWRRCFDYDNSVKRDRVFTYLVRNHLRRLVTDGPRPLIPFQSADARLRQDMAGKSPDVRNAFGAQTVVQVRSRWFKRLSVIIAREDMSGWKSEASDKTASDGFKVLLKNLGPASKQIVECEKTLDIQHLPLSATRLATLSRNKVPHWYRG